jgi:cellobiose transport system permease protein
MSSIAQETFQRSGDNRAANSAVVRKRTWRKYLPLYLSVAPYFLVFLAFNLVPTLFSLYLAFQKWDGIGKMTFVGLSNFRFVLTDPIFGQAVFNTFAIWFMSTIPMLFLALLLAFLLNIRTRSKFAYQLGYFLPYITSTVAISLIFGSLFATQYGLINTMLAGLHLPAVQWLVDSWPMKWAVALMVIWRWTGYNALIYMAGLQSIPSDYYEAARIDGAGTRDIFFSITLPMLRPIILYTVITSSIGGLSLFTEPQVLLGNSGGVGNEGLTMMLYQYWQSFASYRFGYGAAVSWVIFFIMLAFTVLNWRIVQRNDN